MVEHHVLSNVLPILKLVHFIISVCVQSRPAQELGQSLGNKSGRSASVHTVYSIWAKYDPQTNTDDSFVFFKLHQDGLHYRYYSVRLCFISTACSLLQNTILTYERIYCNLHKLLVLIIERLPIFSVVECGHTNYLFFFVDDWQREDIFYGPTAVVKWLWLQHWIKWRKHIIMCELNEIHWLFF